MREGRTRVAKRHIFDLKLDQIEQIKIEARKITKDQINKRGIALAVYPNQEQNVLQEIRSIIGDKSVEELKNGIIVLSNHIFKKDIKFNNRMINRLEQRQWSINQVVNCVQLANKVEEIRCKGVNFNFKIIGPKGGYQRAISIAFSKDYVDRNKNIIVVTIF